MKRPFVALMAVAILCLVAGFTLGHVHAASSARADSAYATFSTSLDKVATIQFTLSMLEQQRTAQLQTELERRLASAIRASRSTIAMNGLPSPMPAIPNLTESFRRAGAYLQARHVHPEAVQDAEWVVTQLKRGSES